MTYIVAYFARISLIHIYRFWSRILCISVSSFLIIKNKQQYKEVAPRSTFNLFKYRATYYFKFYVLW